MTSAVAMTGDAQELPANGRSVVPAGEAARLYRLGLTMGEIAAIYGVSEWVISARLDLAGVRRRRSGGQTVLPVERAVRRYRREPHLLAELAAGLDISPQLIVDRSLRPEPRERGQGRYRADVRAADVADLYRAGWTIKQIAVKYGAAETTIWNRLEHAAVPRRPKSLPVVFPADEAARRARAEEASFASLARDYGISIDAMRYHMAARGVPAPVHAPRVLRGVPATDLAELYAGGLTLAQIAARHGVSSWVIGNRLDRIGVPRRPSAWMPRGQRIPLPLDEVTGLYAGGASLADLAARYQVSRWTVGSRLAEAGITLRPPGGHNRIPLPVDELVALYAAGQTMAQLAARYGVCQTVIYNRLTEAGAPIRHTAGNFKQVDAALLETLARQIGLEALL
jgi:lambda repressor-like predicted transcriptional regulator